MSERCEGLTPRRAALCVLYCACCVAQHHFADSSHAGVYDPEYFWVAWGSAKTTIIMKTKASHSAEQLETRGLVEA